MGLTASVAPRDGGRLAAIFCLAMNQLQPDVRIRVEAVQAEVDAGRMVP